MVSRPPTEDELVERARDGDATAFAALVRDHQEIAFRTAYLITRNAADAEDAAQIGLTKAWRALPRFRRGAPLRPWLLAIVANEARNRRRAEGRREGLALRAAHELPSGDAAPSPEGRAIAAEERAELLAALERLSDDDRLVLSCRYLLDLGEEETGEVLSLRRGTVKSRTSRALGRLREQLGESRCLSSSSASTRCGTRSTGPRRRRSSSRFERRPARRLPLRPLALGFAILLAVLAGVLALSPGARSAFLEIFHIRGATVERVENLPDVRAQRLDYGERVSREEAERRSGFQLLDLGSKPDAIFIRPDGLVSVVYGDPSRPRLVLSQARGAIFDGFIKKTGGSGTIVRLRDRQRRARSLRHRRRALRDVPGPERRHHGREDVPRGHGAPLESRPAAAAAGGRHDPRRGAASWRIRSSREPGDAMRCIRIVTPLWRSA